MKLTPALIGLAALGGVALSSGAASAMPIAPAQTSSVVVPAGYVCNEWGHCWHRHYWHRYYGYGDGYYHPHYWGGWGWRHHYWHHNWYRWHRWHNWNTGD